MATGPDPAKAARGNLPPLQLHVPEPNFRPGDPVDYSYLDIPPAGLLPRPDETCAATETTPLCSGMVRVLDDDHVAMGPWDPKLDPETLRRMLRAMALTRAFDDRMYRGQRQGKTSFYMKCTGEEATSVASTFALAADDMVFPSYRQQGILIARGYPLTEMINQIYSNKADKLKGRQLPIMYSCRDHNFFTISGNLATQYPQAVGWAMASAIKGDSRIATAWVGEGSSAEGDFHAAMTFAAVYNAPVVLNVVNNQWAISSFQGIAGGERTTFAARALGYGLPALRVDGNDFLAVFAATAWAAERARSNLGATLIELYTYRAAPHSTSDDPAGYRPADEARNWPLGDPVERLKQHLIGLGEWDEQRHAALVSELAEEVMSQLKEAMSYGTLGNPPPNDPGSMFEDVLKEIPGRLVMQREQMLALREGN